MFELDEDVPWSPKKILLLFDLDGDVPWSPETNLFLFDTDETLDEYLVMISCMVYLVSIRSLAYKARSLWGEQYHRKKVRIYIPGHKA